MTIPLPRALYRKSALALGILSLVLLPWFGRDAGIPYDESIHHEHGKILYAFFTGESDRAQASPYGPNGEILTADTEWTGFLQGMNLFGGGFDLLSTAAHETILGNFMGEIESRHIIVALFAVICVWAVGALAQSAAGWRASFFAMLFLLASPRFLGHAWNNPKDLPFAALYTLAVFLILRWSRIPENTSWKKRLPLALALAATLGFAVNLRIIGIVLPFYLITVSGLLPLRSPLQARIRKAGAALGVIALAYGLMVFFWPYARLHPFSAPLKIIQTAAGSWIRQFTVLFEGRFGNGEELPWYYHLKWILISSPLFLHAGWIAFAARRPKFDSTLLLLSGFALAPLALSIVSGKTVRHDEWRHFLFAYPACICIAAIGWDRFFEARLPRGIRIVGTVALLGSLVEPFSFILRNHPHEGVYFNPLVGGVSRAYRNYETEVYGTSLRSAVEWIATQTAGIPETERPIRIRVPYGHALSARYFIQRYPHLKFVRVEDNSLEWDYSILMTQSARSNPKLLETWPPAGTIHEIHADEAPLCAIIRNLRLDDLKRTREALLRAGDSLSLARVWLEFGEYDRAITAARAVLTQEPKQAEAISLLALAEFRKGRLAEAISILEDARKRKVQSPDLQRMHEELRMAQDLLSRQPIEIPALLTIAQIYLKQKRWAEAQAAASKALALDPNSEPASYLRFWASGNL